MCSICGHIKAHEGDCQGFRPLKEMKRKKKLQKTSWLNVECRGSHTCLNGHCTTTHSTVLYYSKLYYNKLLANEKLTTTVDLQWQEKHFHKATWWDNTDMEKEPHSEKHSIVGSLLLRLWGDGIPQSPPNAKSGAAGVEPTSPKDFSLCRPRPSLQGRQFPVQPYR